MSNVHITRQGFLTQSTLPNVTRSGTTTVNCDLLILGSGTNGQTTFTDSSVNNYTLTRGGNAQITTAQFPTGMSSSIWLGVSGAPGAFDTINTPQLTKWGSNNFTVECFVYFTTAQWGVVQEKQWWWGGPDFTIKFSNANSSSTGPYNVMLFIDDGGNFPWYIQGSTIFTGLVPNQWNHLAFVREGNTLSGYVNGTRTNQLNYPVTVFGGNGGNRIGGSSPTTSVGCWYGYMSNWRMFIGTAIYSGATITVPSLPLANSVQITTNFTNNTYGVYQNY